MLADLRPFDGWFEWDKWPTAHCPACKLGILAPASKEAVQTVPSAASKRAQANDAWEPEWIRGHFHGVLTCGRPGCNEPCVVAGDYCVDIDDFGQYTDFLKIRFANPPFPLAVTPAGTPPDVEARLDEASRVIWADPASAANGLRRCVEAILDHQKVNKTVLTKSKRRKRLTAQERITLFKTTNPAAAEALEAVKWVGNQGSHGHSALTATDCIESAEYLDLALRLLYDRTDTDIARRARAVNKTRGVPKRRGRT